MMRPRPNSIRMTWLLTLALLLPVALAPSVSAGTSKKKTDQQQAAQAVAPAKP